MLGSLTWITRAAMLIVTLSTLSAFAIEGGGTGVGNGGGSSAVSGGIQLAEGARSFFRELTRSYDFSTIPLAEPCKGKKLSGLRYPKLPPEFNQYYQLEDESGALVSRKWICKNEGNLEAYRSLIHALFRLGGDPLFDLVVSEIVDRQRGPVQFQLRETFRISGQGIKEQAWVEKGVIHWGPPLFINEKGEAAAIRDLFGRWEVPLLMHELGHVLAYTLKPGTQDCVHDLAPLQLDDRQMAYQSFSPESFFAMKTDLESAFYESFSNLLEQPYAWTHPMVYEMAREGLVLAPESNSKSLSDLESNEAYLTTVVRLFLYRPAKPSQERISHPSATHQVKSYELSMDVLMNWTRALIAIEGKADLQAQFLAFDKISKSQEGQLTYKTFFEKSAKSGADFFSYIESLRPEQKNVSPPVEENYRNLLLSKVAKVKKYFENEFPTLQENISSNTKRLNIPDFLKSTSSKLFQLEVHAAIAAITNGTYIQQQFEICDTLGIKVKAAKTRDELDTLYENELRRLLIEQPEWERFFKALALLKAK